MDPNITIILASLGTLLLAVIAGKSAWGRGKKVMAAVQEFIKNFLLAIKDEKLTKEEIDELLKDGRSIWEALSGKYAEEEKKEEAPAEEAPAEEEKAE